MSKKWLKYLPAALIFVLVVAAIVAGLYLKKLFHKDEGPQKKMVQQITMLNPPPPPPPPPPKEEIKEPEVKEEPIKDEKEAPPKDSPEPDAAPEAAEGAGTGNDSFGLGKNTGRAWGVGGGGGYEQFVRQEISDLLTDNDKLKHLAYLAVVTLWIDEAGAFTRIEVEMRDGTPETKKMIEAALQERHKLSRPRPLAAGDRIVLRLKSVL
jgi:protein TonB